MNTENKKEEYDLSSEPQTPKKDWVKPETKEWIKPEFKVLEVNNGGSAAADSTADQFS